MNHVEAMRQALEALEIAQDNLRPHGDNCFLHDEGEYNRCFCGKDSLTNYLQESVEKLRTAIEAAERYEDETFKPDWMNYQEGFAAGVLEGREQIKHEAEKQEPDELRHIGERDCLLDVDEKAWRLLVENRGGCRCHISPPCGACSDLISEEEMNEVGYTYTTPPNVATPQPVPVQRCALCNYQHGHAIGCKNNPVDIALAKLATPPTAQRQWVGLTDEEVKKVHTDAGVTYLVPADYDRHLFTHMTDVQIMKVSRAIEAKLREKNGGAA
jgi:hypothetical protein